MTTNTTTTNGEEYRIERPTPLAELEEKTDAYDQMAEECAKLEATLPEIAETAADLDDEDRAAVADEGHRVRTMLMEAGNVDDLAAVVEELQAVVAHPHRKGVRQAWADVYAALDLGNLNDDTEDRLETLLDGRSVEQLRRDRQVLAGVVTTIQEYPDAAQTVVATALQHDGSYLTDPESTLEPHVETVADQQTALETLDNAIAGYDWAPDTMLAETADLYDPQVDPVDPEVVTERLEGINSIVDKEWGPIDVEAVVRAHLQRALDAATAADLEAVFQSAHECVSDCADYRRVVTHAGETVACVDDESTHDSETVARRLDDACGDIEPGDAGGALSLNTLLDQLDALDGAYSSWVRTYVKTLRRDGKAVTAVSAVLDTPPSFDPPDEALAITEVDPDKDMVWDDPAAAVAAHDTYRDWASRLREHTASGAPNEEDRAVDYLIALVRGEAVPAEELSGITFDQLRDQLEGGLTLQFDGPSSTGA